MPKQWPRFTSQKVRGAERTIGETSKTTQPEKTKNNSAWKSDTNRSSSLSHAMQRMAAIGSARRARVKQTNVGSLASEEPTDLDRTSHVIVHVDAALPQQKPSKPNSRMCRRAKTRCVCVCACPAQPCIYNGFRHGETKGSRHPRFSTQIASTLRLTQTGRITGQPVWSEFEQTQQLSCAQDATVTMHPPVSASPLQNQQKIQNH